MFYVSVAHVHSDLLYFHYILESFHQDITNIHQIHNGIIADFVDGHLTSTLYSKGLGKLHTGTRHWVCLLVLTELKLTS